MKRILAVLISTILLMASAELSVYASFEEDVVFSSEEDSFLTDATEDSAESSDADFSEGIGNGSIRENNTVVEGDADIDIFADEGEINEVWKDAEEISEEGESSDGIEEFTDENTSLFTSGTEEEPDFCSGEEEIFVEESSLEELLTAEAALPAKKVNAPAGCSASKLQSLLDLNKDGKSQLILTIPAGTYHLNRPLFVNSNTIIRASQKARLIKQARYGAMIESRLRKSKNGTDGGYNSCRNVTIEGGIWDTAPLLGALGGTESFRFIHCTNITIQNLTLCNVPRKSHLLVLAGVKNSVVKNCKFYGYGNGQNLNSDAKEAIQLDVVHSAALVPNQQKDVITWDDLACDGITISGCEFHDFARGIGSHMAVAGHEHNNIVIQGNHFYNIYDNVIRLFNYKNTKVKENLIERAPEGIFVYTDFHSWCGNYLPPNKGKKYSIPSNYNIEISGNTIRNIPSGLPEFGNGIRILGSEERPVRGVKIVGNVIKSTGMYGIWADWAPGITVSNNKGISSSKKHGILLEHSSSGKILGNTVSRAGQSGIAFYYSNGVSVCNNKLSDIAIHGIYGVQSSKCTVGKSVFTGNNITNTGKDAVCLTSPSGSSKGCKSASVSYNTIKNAGRYGIYTYYSSGVNINQNTIAAKDNGILLKCSGGKSKAAFNTVTSGTNGIRVVKSSTASVVSNTIKRASGNGIYCSESNKSTLKSNVVQAAGKYGIYLVKYNKDSVITKNTVNKFASVGNYSGICTSSSEGCTITSNQIFYSGTKKPKGIYVHKSNKTTVKSNTIKGCSKKNAIVLSGSSGCKKSGNKI